MKSLWIVMFLLIPCCLGISFKSIGKEIDRFINDEKTLEKDMKELIGDEDPKPHTENSQEDPTLPMLCINQVCGMAPNTLPGSSGGPQSSQVLAFNASINQYTPQDISSVILPPPLSCITGSCTVPSGSLLVSDGTQYSPQNATQVVDTLGLGCLNEACIGASLGDSLVYNGSVYLPTPKEPSPTDCIDTICPAKNNTLLGSMGGNYTSLNASQVNQILGLECLDLECSAVQNNTILVSNGTIFAPQNSSQVVSTLGLGCLSDACSNALDGDTLVYNETLSVYVPTPKGPSPTDCIDDLICPAQNNTILGNVYGTEYTSLNSSQVNVILGLECLNLECPSLNETTSGYFLVYNGTNYVPEAPATLGLCFDSSNCNANPNDLLVFNGTDYVAKNISQVVNDILPCLSGVCNNDTTNGDVLAWNSSTNTYQPVSPSTIVNESLPCLSSACINATNGSLLTYNSNSSLYLPQLPSDLGLCTNPIACSVDTTNGSMLIYNSNTTLYEPATPNQVVQDILPCLTGACTNTSDGDVLIYSSTAGSFVPQALKTLEITTYGLSNPATPHSPPGNVLEIYTSYALGQIIYNVVEFQVSICLLINTSNADEGWIDLALDPEYPILPSNNIFPVCTGTMINGIGPLSTLNDYSSTPVIAFPQNSTSFLINVGGLNSLLVGETNNSATIYMSCSYSVCSTCFISNTSFDVGLSTGSVEIQSQEGGSLSEGTLCSMSFTEGDFIYTVFSTPVVNSLASFVLNTNASYTDIYCCCGDNSCSGSIKLTEDEDTYNIEGSFACS
jgi:hypothetical protein